MAMHVVCYDKNNNVIGMMITPAVTSPGYNIMVALEVTLCDMCQVTIPMRP